MCGIYGYLGNKAACQIILGGLRRLEYRGYDSWGMATIADGRLYWIKRIGDIPENDETLRILPGNIGIGHVRWATHGAISERNAHPHFDCKGEIAIVHNGVIYNESSVRSRLAKSGHSFSSNTDTELFAHLLEEKSELSFIDAIYECVKEIDAQYSFLILAEREPNKIYAARNKSPLKIGISERGFHISSDIVSLVGKATRYTDLEDGDVAEIGFDGFKIYDKNKRLVQRELNPIDISEEMITKEPPYFLKEVQEEERVIKDIINRCIRNDEIDLGIDLDKIAGVENVILTGAGSSFFASMVGEYYLRIMTRLIHVESVLAGELKQKYAYVDSSSIPGNMLLIVLTQSGETRDTLDAIEFMRSKGVPALTLVNRPRTEAAKISDFVIELPAGPEMSVVASKTFVAEVLMLLLFSIALARKKGITKGMRELSEEIKRLPLSINTIFGRENEIKQIAAKYCDEDKFYPLSTGINVAVALEIGRKLEEGLYVNAVGTSLGTSSELKHGPLTMVSGKTLIFIVSPGSGYQKMLISMEEAKAREAKIIAIATERDEAVQRIADDAIWIPKCSELLTPILSIIPLQLLTYYIGKESSKGNLDRPRNLAKSVTV